MIHSDLVEQIGSKATNLLRLKTMSAGEVPAFLPLSHTLCLAHLNQFAPQWQKLWEQFKTQQGEETAGLAQGTHETLEELRDLIIKTFSEHPLRQMEVEDYFKELDRSDHLMVRSTGKEDTQELANPGGNESFAGVHPDLHSISEYVGRVIASYFSEKSLEQRIKSKKGDSVLSDPFMPVLLQKMITEDQNMVYSGVLYANERGSRVDVAPGHGEYVVNSKGPFDSYFVSHEGVVHQQIYQKPVRLVPVFKEGSCTLELKQNEPSLRNKASLPVSVVKRLDVIGKKINEQYGMPMDIEFVYQPKTNKIFIVQARPIVKGLSDNIIPSAIAPEHIRKVKETVSWAPAKMITPAGSRAQVVESKKELLIYHTIAEALETFLGMKDDTGKIKAVIVKRDAPTTSHEAAMFNAVGIPVFYIGKTEERKIDQFLHQKNIKLILDPQRGLIVDWNGKNENDILKEGFFKSSLTAARTVTPEIEQQIDQHIIEEGYHLMYKGSLNEAMLDKPYQYMIDLLEQIEGVRAGEGKEALNALGMILRYFYVVARAPSSELDSERKALLFQHSCLLCVNLKRLLEEIDALPSKEIDSKIQNELLDLVNGLEGLITDQGKGKLFSDSLYQTGREHAVIKELQSKWPDKFNKLTEVNREAIIQLYRFGAGHAASNTIKEQWINFIFKVNDIQKLHELNALVYFSQDNEMGDFLINHIFNQMIAENIAPEQILNQMNAVFKHSKEVLEQHQFWKFESTISEWETKVSLWSKRRNYLSLIKDFEKDIDESIKFLQSLGDLNALPLLARKKVLDEVAKLVEVIDISIKSMRGSLDYKDHKEQQVKNFFQMLKSNHQFMQYLVNLLPDEVVNEWRKGDKVEEDTALKQWVSDEIESSFKVKQDSLSTKDMNPSGNIAINSATINSPVSFRRQFIGVQLTLEDYLSLFHQNSVIAHAALSKDLQLSIDSFPPVLQQVHREIIENIINAIYVSSKANDNKIYLEYNIPLNVHAAKLFVEYDSLTNEVQFRPEIYAPNRGGDNRMETIVSFSNQILSHFLKDRENIKQIRKPVYRTHNMLFSSTAAVTSEQFNEDHRELIQLINAMAQMTFGSGHLDLDWILEMNVKEAQREQKLQLLKRLFGNNFNKINGVQALSLFKYFVKEYQLEKFAVNEEQAYNLLNALLNNVSYFLVDPDYFIHNKKEISDFVDQLKILDEAPNELALKLENMCLQAAKAVTYKNQGYKGNELALVCFIPFLQENTSLAKELFAQLPNYGLTIRNLAQINLFQAALVGNLEELTAVLKKPQGIMITKRDAFALLCAASNGQLEAVKLILSKGSGLDTTTMDTAIKAAHKAKHVDVVNEILAKNPRSTFAEWLERNEKRPKEQAALYQALKKKDQNGSQEEQPVEQKNQKGIQTFKL